MGGSPFWSQWQLAPEVLIPALLLASFYLRNCKEATAQEGGYFAAGLISLLAVVNSPIGTMATTYFWCHMLQHMTLMMITGPLLVLGTVRHFRPRSQVWKTLTNPWVSWFIYAALMIGVHFTALHQLLMSHGWLHDFIEVPAYAVVAYVFYYNLLDRDNPERVVSPGMAIFSLFFMMVPETLTGFFIYAAPNSLYGEMFTINDQRLGGSLMWAGSMIIDVIWISIAVSDWLKSEERKSKEIDEEIRRER